MAFDFWAAQRRARGRTKVYLALFILLTLLVAAGAEIAMRVFSNGSYRGEVPVVGLIFLIMTFGVAAFNYVMYKQYGGSYVAESLGGKRVYLNANDLKERQLLNVVGEMAIASSMPIPAIYVIPADEINAFASGTTKDNAAIAVTRGTLLTLNREELQGVVAHEFGHIYNGDMRISLQLAAMVLGFFFILYLGLRIFEISAFTGLGGRSDNNKRGNPVMLAALILFVAGSITYFFGTLLKFAVSREREYLADACAVQFTRNPSGIANALKKIAGYKVADMPKNGTAYSHMYIEDKTAMSSLFATHPPIKKRIAAIEGQTYMPEEWLEQERSARENGRDSSRTG